jgi:hypothetical protein
MSRLSWADADETTIHADDGRAVPADPHNSDYAEIMRSAAPVAPHSPAPPTDQDVQEEYERRLLLLLEARDLAHAGFIRADDTDETAVLLAIASPAAEQKQRLNELLARRDAINRLIDAYNRIPSPPPADYDDDRHWS